MLHRSHTKRSLRAAVARLLALAVSLSVVGCQSNSDRDLIARDRRMQEDQIYALQDYVNQYQRLLCKYRSENASLRRQLTESYPVETPSSEQQPALHSRLIPTPKDSPQFQAPATPGVKQQQVPLPAAPPAVETPEVPPLKTSTDATPPPPADHSNANRNDGSPVPLVLPASYEELAQPDVRSKISDDADASHSVSTNGTTLNLSGEVVANGNRGRRLKIEVAPADQSKPFIGTTSLMLLAVNDAGEEHSLGRWDYSASDVQSALDMSAPAPLMRYFVELPLGAPLNESTELWVRLVPQSGEKLLAHANVNLASPGTFSSSPLPSPTQHADIVAATYTDEQSLPTADVPVETTGTTWAVALPGKPANLSPEARDESGAGGWRASSEPMPLVPVAKTDDRPTRKHRPIIRHEKQAESTVTEVPKSPTKQNGWSPERSGDAPRSTANRPSWSATR